LLRRVGYREAVSKYLPFRLTSPNAIDPAETFTAFLLSVVARARRFAHTSLLRADAALHAMLGISRIPVDDTIRNLFKRFGRDSASVFSPACGVGSWNGFRDVRRDIVWIWIPRCSSATGDSRVRCVGRIRASMGGPRIIRWWRCWPRRTFSCTAVAERKLWHGPRRGVFSQGGASAVAGKTCPSRGARRRRLF
jgi:hypothetical protein